MQDVLQDVACPSADGAQAGAVAGTKSTAAGSGEGAFDASGLPVETVLASCRALMMDQGKSLSAVALAPLVMAVEQAWMQLGWQRVVGGVNREQVVFLMTSPFH